jgi:hypothetical protein
MCSAQASGKHVGCSRLITCCMFNLLDWNAGIFMPAVMLHHGTGGIAPGTSAGKSASSP